MRVSQPDCNPCLSECEVWPAWLPSCQEGASVRECCFPCPWPPLPTSAFADPISRASASFSFHYQRRTLAASKNMGPGIRTTQTGVHFPLLRSCVSLGDQTQPLWSSIPASLQLCLFFTAPEATKGLMAKTSSCVWCLPDTSLMLDVLSTVLWSSLIPGS